MKRKFSTLTMLMFFLGISSVATAQDVSVDRFSMEAGNLFVRDESNGLPGPNEPIDFDVEPFITKGFGPDGELISYYNFDVMPTEPAPIFVLFHEGESAPVEGQMNIIDVIPGDAGYNDFWEVQKVTVPVDYVANTVTSYTQIMDASYTIEETTILVNCPVVPYGSTAKLRLGEESTELTVGWYKGMTVYYFNFAEKALMVDESDMVPISPIFVSFNINPDMEGGGPPSGFVTDPATGRTHNVVATLPDDAGYSPLWEVSVYDNADFDNVGDLASAQGANIMATGVANVNCPVVAKSATVDRFSMEAGNLFVRDESNGLPGPNEPIDFDVEPFITKGLGPDGELISYYNFDVMPTEPAPIFVLFHEGESVPVEGQMNIIDVIPGDAGYNDFWEVQKVTVPVDYVANTVTSYTQIMGASYTIEETTILVNCPVVPYGSTAKLRLGGESTELTVGWYKGMTVYYFNFAEKALMVDESDMVPISPIFVSFNINPDMEGGGPPSGFMTDPATGRTHNVVATLPDDEGYSPLWEVSVYDNADFDNVGDLASAQGANIMATGVANVNCPVVAKSATVDRFSMEAGNLFVRDESNGLPGPNEPIDFDVEPFITKGFGPDGELISYYNFDVMPTEPAPIFVLFHEGESVPVEGQMNIIDVIPGDAGYNDFWEVQKVTVPVDYVANTVTSYTQIMDASYTIEETTILVNCPVVPYGSTAKLRLGGESTELTVGWYKGMTVYYFNFAEKALMVDESDMVPTSPIYVSFNINPDMEGGGPPSGFVTDPATGRTHNVVATLPDDAGYSPLWEVSVYDNADFDNVGDLASAQGANIMAIGVANVNCPVVAKSATVDRFSMEAGNLFVRDESNGLPGPNEPIDFDVEPFITKGLGPDGELISYYNFDVMPTEPAPIFVLFLEGESAPVEGQMNIIDVIPGDAGYNDFWEVQKVTVPVDYVANTVTSYNQIMDAGYTIEETTILVNCPVVPYGSTAKLRLGEESTELTVGWYKGMTVYYFNFAEKALMVDESDMVPTSPIYVSFNINPDMEGGGPPSGFVTDPATGRTHNVVATLPDDAGYSPLWEVSVYDNADFDNVGDLASAQGANIMAIGVANVNCPVVMTEEATSVEDIISTPVSVSLEQNYPNPFRSTTEIRFGTAQQEKITIRVFNIRGELVAELLNQTVQPGDHTIQWNPQNEAGGIYLYTIHAGSFHATKRMTLLK